MPLPATSLQQYKSLKWNKIDFITHTNSFFSDSIAEDNTIESDFYWYRYCFGVDGGKHWSLSAVLFPNPNSSINLIFLLCFYIFPSDKNFHRQISLQIFPFFHCAALHQQKCNFTSFHSFLMGESGNLCFQEFHAQLQLNAQHCCM